MFVSNIASKLNKKLTYIVNMLDTPIFAGRKNKDLSKALSELISCLGVKEELSCDELFALLKKRIKRGACRRSQFGLVCPFA